MFYNKSSIIETKVANNGFVEQILIFCFYNENFTKFKLELGWSNFNRLSLGELIWEFLLNLKIHLILQDLESILPVFTFFTGEKFYFRIFVICTKSTPEWNYLVLYQKTTRSSLPLIFAFLPLQTYTVCSTNGDITLAVGVKLDKN